MTARDDPSRGEERTMHWFHDEHGTEASVVGGARPCLRIHNAAQRGGVLEFVLLEASRADGSLPAVFFGTVAVDEDGGGAADLPPECRAILGGTVYLVLGDIVPSR